MLNGLKPAPQHWTALRGPDLCYSFQVKAYTHCTCNANIPTYTTFHINFDSEPEYQPESRAHKAAQSEVPPLRLV